LISNHANKFSPGARVDTPCPTYQLRETETWDTWEWREKFPGRDELADYFRHLDKVWDLSKDITYDTRITKMQWDASQSRWNLDLNGGNKKITAWSVVLCTGFASKAVIPPYKGIDSFKGDKIHTSRWPQQGYNTDNKRVAIMGAGATGVQTIQEVSKTAGHLTVFQRTANTALPMQNPRQDANSNKAMRDKFPQTREKMMKTFAGFDYEFDFTKPCHFRYGF
jgi:cyclohexanone monooxygenase